MATLLFVYSRTSIQAAKRNAQKHREADGGQINWHNESLRRHGRLEGPGEGASVVNEIVEGLKGEGKGKSVGDGGMGKVVAETDSERILRERTGKGRG